MKKRLLLTAGALLIVGSAITILLWRYAARDASLSAFTEKDLAEASRRHAVDNGFATPVSSATPTVPIKSNQRVRLAIGSLGFSEDRQNHEIGDLLTAELSNAKGLELVDRQSFDKVLQETELNLSGLVRARDAIRVGKLLRADWFLLANRSTNVVVGRLVDARTGVLLDIGIVSEEGGPAALASKLAQFVRTAREAGSKATPKNYLAIGQFADVSLNNRQAAFESQLRTYLTSVYRNSGITLLERAEVAALLTEVQLDLAGLSDQRETAPSAAPFQSAFWVVEGEFQSYETTSQEVEVVVRINRMFERSTERTFRGIPDNPLFEKIKNAVDSTIQQANRYALVPTRSGEIRLQMSIGKELHSLATGGWTMEVTAPGFYRGDLNPQAPALRRRNMEAAIRAFQTVLLLDPQNLEAKFDLAVCTHDASIGRYDEARGYFQEVAASTNHNWSRAALLSLGRSYEFENSRQATRWLETALQQSKTGDEANYVRQLLADARERTVKREIREQGGEFKPKQTDFITAQLFERMRVALNVMEGRGGGIDPWYGLMDFAENFRHDHQRAAGQINELLPMLKTNFPSMVPHILAAAVSLQVDTNSPVVEEFKESLDKLRVDPTHLVGSTYYFKNLFLSTYPWCMKNNMYSLAAELVEIKNQASTHDPKLKLTQTERIMLAYAYINLERWGEALAILHELGDTPVEMDSSGPWGGTFTVILPGSLADQCRSKLGVGPVSDAIRFDFGDPFIRLSTPAPFLAEPNGIWLVVGNRLLQLDHDLKTNVAAILPGVSVRATALAVDPDSAWIATEGAGLFRYRKAERKFQQFTEKDGLLMDYLMSLCVAGQRLWLGFGINTPGNDTRGGLGRLDLDSMQLTMFSPTLAATLKRQGSSGSQPPQQPVFGVGAARPDELLLLVAHSGLHRYDLKRDRWDKISLNDRSSIYSFTSDSDRLICGIAVPQPNGAWLGGVAIQDYTSDKWETILADGSLPGPPNHALLRGADLFVGGRAFVAVVDLKIRKVRKICYVATTMIDDLQVAGDYLWCEFGNSVSRVAIKNLR